MQRDLDGEAEELRKEVESRPREHERIVKAWANPPKEKPRKEGQHNYILLPGSQTRRSED